MKKQYYPSINMLRGIAALMVCIFHFTHYADFRGSLFPSDSFIHQFGEYGLMGVYVFFVITGFIIPFSLLKYDYKISQIHRYLAKRWVRIETPYIASIALTLLVLFLFSLKNGIPFEINFSQLGHHIFYTIPFSGETWYNPIYWTLAIEMQFYILIAILFPILMMKAKLWQYSIPGLLAFSALFLDDPRFVFYYAPIFAQGIYLLLIQKGYINKNIGALLILSCALLTVYTISWTIAISCLLTILVIAFVTIDHKIFNRLGDISYSLYLTHGVIGGNVIYLLARYINNYALKIALVLLAIILSLIAAFLFWKIIENPSKKWSKKIKL